MTSGGGRGMGVSHEHEDPGRLVEILERGSRA